MLSIRGGLKHQTSGQGFPGLPLSYLSTSWSAAHSGDFGSRNAFVCVWTQAGVGGESVPGGCLLVVSCLVTVAAAQF